MTRLELLRRVPRSVACREDHQCPTGFFCEVSQLSCRGCLSCQALGRETRENTTSCVTSATACGACLAGLVPGETNNSCLSPNDGQILLPYEWAIVIGASLLLAVIICVAALYVLRNFNTFKILASTRATVSTPVDVEATAPQLPPSYAVATLPHGEQLRSDNETAPFIKQISSPQITEARESAGSQATRVYNNPSYVRILQPSYDTPNHNEMLPIIQEVEPDVNTNTESNRSAIAMAAEAPVELASYPSMVMQTPSSKDTNNNGPHEDGRDSTFANNGITGAAFIINVIRNVNTVQQTNEISTT